MLASTAGYEVPDDEPPRDAVVFWAPRSNGIITIVFVRTDPGQLVTGANYPLDFGSTSGAIIDFDTRVPTPPTLVAFLLGGSLQVTEATQTDGARVFGTIQAELYPNFF